MKYYYLFGRLIAPAFMVAMYVYSLLTKTTRVRVIVYNNNSAVLLVKTWPSSGEWSLPGGGVERGEQQENAASRELREETGLSIPPEDLRSSVMHKSFGHTEVVFIANVHDNRKCLAPPNRWEVLRAEWFDLASLPRVTSDTRYVLTEVAKKR